MHSLTELLISSLVFVLKLLIILLLSINTESRTVYLADEEVHISSAEYLLLHYLASNAGQVVSRDSVFKATKGREYDGLDRSVDVLISSLRKKFNDDPQHPEKIKTIWAKGYLLVATAWQ